jgi:hypothetical protein
VRSVESPSLVTRREYVKWVSALSLAGLFRPLVPDEAALGRAGEAARLWLEGLDAGRTAQSHARAAPVFRAALSAGEWDAAVRAVRTPLGACLRRRVRSSRLVAELGGRGGAPHALFHFDTDFERRAMAAETVTAVRGADGRWRVVGYFIA